MADRNAEKHAFIVGSRFFHLNCLAPGNVIASAFMNGPMQKAVRMLKIGWLGFWAGLATFVVFIPVTIAARLDPTQRMPEYVVQFWARLILGVTGVKTRSSGLEKIQDETSYVIISNHQSHFDILALAVELPLIVRFVIKKELRKIPFFGYSTVVLRCIYVDRSDSAQAVKSLQAGIRKLPPTVSMLFFAEGTRSPDGRIGPFKKGGFRTAQVAGWPILPVVVRGSRKVLPKGDLAFRPGTIEVEVLDPMPWQEVQARRWEEMMEDVRQKIVTHFDKG
jgi:1-acyl-sn-glycerol-3-phosphate acyltransferase